MHKLENLHFSWSISGLLALGSPNPAHNWFKHDDFWIPRRGSFRVHWIDLVFPRVNCTSACMILVGSAHFHCGVFTGGVEFVQTLFLVINLFLLLPIDQSMH